MTNDLMNAKSVLAHCNRQLRESRGWTARQMAEALGYADPSTVLHNEDRSPATHYRVAPAYVYRVFENLGRDAYGPKAKRWLSLALLACGERPAKVWYQLESPRLRRKPTGELVWVRFAGEVQQQDLQAYAKHCCDELADLIRRGGVTLAQPVAEYV